MIINDSEFPPLPSQVKRKSHPKSNRKKPAAQKRENGITTANDLPDELFLEILQYLPCLDLDNFNQRTIISLSLTNRRLHYIVEKELYTAYNNFFCNPYLFLRTCANNRRIAEKVQTLELSYGPGVQESCKRYTPSVADRRDLKAAFKNLSIPGWKEWATDCNDESVNLDILYASILMFTPNVKSLTIDDGSLPYGFPKWLNLIQSAVTGASLGTVHRFSHLESIRIDVEELSLRHLWSLFRLPSLRQLTLLGLSDNGDANQSILTTKFWKAPPGSSPIQELVLLDCLLSLPHLVLLIKSCATLRVFAHRHHGQGLYIPYMHANPSRDPVNLRYPGLIAALKPHHHSLETLQLWSKFEEQRHPHDETGFMGDFGDFKNVTTLKASFSALVNPAQSPTMLVRSLPPSLRTLTLSVGGASRELDCMPALEYMAAHCRTYLPRLENIHADVKFPKSLVYYGLDRLQKPFRDAGVKLHVTQPLAFSAW